MLTGKRKASVPASIDTVHSHTLRNVPMLSLIPCIKTPVASSIGSEAVDVLDESGRNGFCLGR